MIQIVDYQNGLYGISQTQEWGGNTLNLKINDTEFNLPIKAEITLTEIPEKIFKKRVISPVLLNYLDKEGNTLRVDEYQKIIGELTEAKVWDDDAEESIWETREDKEKYEQFISNWKSVYSESTIEWVPEEFELIVKEPVPDKYKYFITSSIIVETRNLNGIYDNNNKYKKAICYYFSNPTAMIQLVAKELGFTIVDNENKTEGLNIFIYKISDSVLRFSKVNGNYFKIPENIWKQYRNITGSLQQCIANYEWEYKQIYEFLLGVHNTINNKTLSPEERNELFELINVALINYNEIDYKKGSDMDYRSLGKTLLSIKRKISMLPE